MFIATIKKTWYIINTIVLVLCLRRKQCNEDRQHIKYHYCTSNYLDYYTREQAYMVPEMSILTNRNM